MKIMSVVGARPNFMKVAPIIAAIEEHNSRPLNGNGCANDNTIEHILVHTGQHYDQVMSDSFFSDLGLPKPHAHLGVGSGSHAVQTAEVMKKFEEVLIREKPDVLVVVGDVNSTLACALVTAKIFFDGGARPLVAHVEAGLRSFDRAMPEEVNRILTDHLSDLLFVTEESGLSNLASEGVAGEKVHFVGNTMIDSLLAFKNKAERSTILDDLKLRKNFTQDHRSGSVVPYALLTLHRPANVDDCETFLNILDGLEDLTGQYPVIFPAHPRTHKRIREFGFEGRFDWDDVQCEVTNSSSADSGSRPIRIIDPLGYVDFLSLMSNAAMVITDSGGIQEETTCLGVPCVTVRENTERPVTIKTGTNILAGVTASGIRTAIGRQLKSKIQGAVPELWDGKASVRILEVLRRECGQRKSSLYLATSAMPALGSVTAST